MEFYHIHHVTCWGLFRFARVDQQLLSSTDIVYYKT